MKLVQSRDEINPNPSKVGQAVYDLLSTSQKPQTVEETLEASFSDFLKHFNMAVDRGMRKYPKDFYIVVLGKKEPWAMNVERQYFIDRQTAPFASDMVSQWPNYNKTLYKIDREGKRDPEIHWSIPGHQDCISIAKNPGAYHPMLVRWVLDAYEAFKISV